MAWRSELDEITRKHLELQIKEVSKYRKAYSKSKNPSKTQLWCAVANLSKMIGLLDEKYKKLEGSLGKKETKKSSKKKLKKRSKRSKKR